MDVSGSTSFPLGEQVELRHIYVQSLAKLMAHLLEEAHFTCEGRDELWGVHASQSRQRSGPARVQPRGLFHNDGHCGLPDLGGQAVRLGARRDQQTSRPRSPIVRPGRPLRRPRAGGTALSCPALLLAAPTAGFGSSARCDRQDQKLVYTSQLQPLHRDRLPRC